MAMTSALEGGQAGVDKGLPPLPLPTMMDALAAHTRALRMDDGRQTGTSTPTGFVNSRKLTAKSKRKMKEPDRGHHSPSPLLSLATDITPPDSYQGSPATPTPGHSGLTFPSLGSARSLATRFDPRNPFDSTHSPSSPSAASQLSFSCSTTPRSPAKFSFGTKSSTQSAASIHSSHTMPDMVAYNDVDQWGAPRTSTSPKRGTHGLSASAGPGGGLRRKNSSSKMLVNGLSRSLTRMGSVMKRSTSDNNMSSSVSSSRRKEWMTTKKKSRQSIVAEEMGAGWERVDMQREVTEGDSSITRPFNVEHDLHVSPDLGDMPPAWLDALKAQGLSEADLLLIAAARHKAAQTPRLRIVKGSTPPPNDMQATLPGPTHHHSRGMSTPAYLIADGESPADRPLLNKRFSWERGPATPQSASTPAAREEAPVSPFRAFRQSLQDSPVHPDTPVQSRTPPHSRTPTQLATPRRLSEADDVGAMEQTPTKTKRWSDQLRGFQTSFSTLGGEDDWGSQLTMALNGGDTGLQTVHEVDSRGPSLDSTRSHLAQAAGRNDDDFEVDTRAPGALDRAAPSRDHRRNTKSLSINSAATPPISGPRSPVSPVSAHSPGGTRIRRKPVPSISSHKVSLDRRKLSGSVRSLSSGIAGQSMQPGAPIESSSGAKVSPPSDTVHAAAQQRGHAVLPHLEPGHRHSQSVTQSNESEIEHDIRTPSTNRHFFHSPSSSLSHPPPLPRSISEESQFTLAYGRGVAATIPPPLVTGYEANADKGQDLASFSFPPKAPARPNPRHSVPASAGCTESSPPSRGPTPPCGDSDFEDSPQAYHQTGIPVVSPSHHLVPPVTPPSRSPRRSSSRRTKSGRPSPPGIDPMSSLDQANTMAERASIALSLVSGAGAGDGDGDGDSDPRSSLASSLRSSYLHDAKVLKAYTRDLSGVEEGGERESASSETDSSAAHNNQSSSASQEDSSAAATSADEVPHHHQQITPAKSRQSPHSRPHSHSSRNRSSRRHKTSPVDTPPKTLLHPFAYRKPSTQGYETDDDPLSVFEEAARDIAERRERWPSVSSDRRGSAQGVFSDAEE